MPKVKVFVNPLKGAEHDHSKPDWLVSFLCVPGTPNDAESLEKRWQEISEEQSSNLFAPPDEPRILNQLVWRLRHAKGSYVVGNYLGTIALVGVVAEMATILAWDIGEPSLNSEPIDKKRQEQLFGKSFDRLEQVRRIGVLRSMGFARPEFTDALNRICGIRNEHMHVPTVRDEKLEARHAREAFLDAVYVVSVLIGQTIKDGSIQFTAPMMNYLKRLNVTIEDPPKEAGDPPPSENVETSQ
jgi:hypothetical protein